MTNSKTLRIGEVANIFGVTRATVRNWADDGKLHCFRTLGGERRFEAAEVYAARDDDTRDL